MWANRMLIHDKWPPFAQRSGSLKTSAGLLMFRQVCGNLQLFLMHPGGPYLRNHDLGTWTIPKGQIQPGEVVLHAACRRFTEEVGVAAFGPFIPLRPAFERTGNIVNSWAFEGDYDPAAVASDSPELSRAAWLTPAEAKFRIDPSQAWWIDEVVAQLRTQ